MSVPLSATLFGRLQSGLYSGAPLMNADDSRPGHRQIRVLDLLPGADDDSISCTIRLISLDSDETYEALSYVWGDRVGEKEIDIAGHCVSVTANLYAALRRLRHAQHNTRTIWIDQLSVNQQDNLERSIQVALMRDIYRRCSSCVIWLGEMDQDQDFSIHDAREVFRFIEYAADLKETEPGHLPLIFRPTMRGDRTRKAFEAFSMYGNPWWSRVWTIQEAIVPSSSVFVWGVLSIDRDLVVRASKNLRSCERTGLFSPQFRVHRLKYTPLLRRLLYPMHGFRHAERDDGPLDLLMRWRHRHATDPRDKVYALAGLLTPGVIPSAEQCSYDLPVADLFQNVTVDLIKYEDSLRALVGSQELPHCTPNLASWAIDFACVNVVGTRQLKWWNRSHRYGQFWAAAKTPLQVTTARKGSVLALTGIFVDEVLDISTEYTVLEREYIEDEPLLEVLNDARHLLDHCRASYAFGDNYINGSSYDTAFFCTVIGDLVMKEFPVRRAGPHDETSFNSLLEHLGKRSYTGSHEVVDLFISGQQNFRHMGDFGTVLAKQYETMVPDFNFEPFDLHESLSGMMANHRFFVTKKGYIGVGPPDTKAGDEVWIFHGGNVPFISRRTEVDSDLMFESHHHVRLVGDAYVHGIMDGEAMQGNPETQSVWLH